MLHLHQRWGIGVETLALESLPLPLSGPWRLLLLGDGSGGFAFACRVFGWAFALWGTALYWWAAVLYMEQARRVLRARNSAPDLLAH